MKKKELSYDMKRRIAINNDPYFRIVERNLRELIANKDKEILLDNLKCVGKPYSKYHSFIETIKKPTLGVNSFIKYMRASGVREFTITITDEELKNLEDNFDIGELK